MPTITDIKAERVKRRKERVVYVDGEKAFSLTEETYLRFGLTVGQTIAQAELQDMMLTDGVARAREQALRLLNYRMRTRKELEQRLRRNEWSHEVIECVMERLEKAGFIDDRQYARLWVDERLRLKPVGLNMLRRELKRKGIDAETVEATLKAYDDQDEEAARAYDLLSRRAHQYVNLEPPVAQRRMTGFLARRGFNQGVIYQVVRQIMDEVKESEV